MADTGKTFTPDEVKKHNKEDDLWIIIRGKVYDVTKYLDDHPGGEILMDAGVDGTEMFDDIGHSKDAEKEMEAFLIGELVK